MSEDLVVASADPPTARDLALVLLDERERQALEYFETSYRLGTTAPIAPSTADRMFTLWLRGLSTEDIRALNWGFGLGAIVDARVRYGWDRRMAEYDQQQVTDTAAAIRRAQIETAALAADMLSASALLNREKLQRYMMTRDERDLGDLAITNTKQWKDALEILLKATQQDQPRPARAPMPSEDDPLPIGVPASAGGVVALAAQQRQVRLTEMAAARARRRR